MSDLVPKRKLRTVSKGLSQQKTNQEKPPKDHFLNAAQHIIFKVYCYVCESMILYEAISHFKTSPGQVAQFIRASSQYIKFACCIPGQGTYNNQPMNALHK